MFHTPRVCAANCAEAARSDTSPRFMRSSFHKIDGRFHETRKHQQRTQRGIDSVYVQWSEMGRLVNSACSSSFVRAAIGWCPSPRTHLVTLPFDPLHPCSTRQIRMFLGKRTARRVRLEVASAALLQALQRGFALRRVRSSAISEIHGKLWQAALGASVFRGTPVGHR